MTYLLWSCGEGSASSWSYMSLLVEIEDAIDEATYTRGALVFLPPGQPWKRGSGWEWWCYESFEGVPLPAKRLK